MEVAHHRLASPPSSVQYGASSTLDTRPQPCTAGRRATSRKRKRRRMRCGQKYPTTKRQEREQSVFYATNSSACMRSPLMLSISTTTHRISLSLLPWAPPLRYFWCSSLLVVALASQQLSSSSQDLTPDSCLFLSAALAMHRRLSVSSLVLASCETQHTYESASQVVAFLVVLQDVWKPVYSTFAMGTGLAVVLCAPPSCPSDDCSRCAPQRANNSDMQSLLALLLSSTIAF